MSVKFEQHLKVYAALDPAPEKTPDAVVSADQPAGIDEGKASAPKAPLDRRVSSIRRVQQLPVEEATRSSGDGDHNEGKSSNRSRRRSQETDTKMDKRTCFVHVP